MGTVFNIGVTVSLSHQISFNVIRNPDTFVNPQTFHSKQNKKQKSRLFRKSSPDSDADRPPTNSRATHSFIHSGYFYSTSSSPLLLRGTPNYSIDTVSELTRRSTLHLP